MTNLLLLLLRFEQLPLIREDPGGSLWGGAHSFADSPTTAQVL